MSNGTAELADGQRATPRLQRHGAIALRTAEEVEAIARVLSQPRIVAGKIMSELAKMMGMTPEWFRRSGR